MLVPGLLDATQNRFFFNFQMAHFEMWHTLWRRQRLDLGYKLALIGGQSLSFLSSAVSNEQKCFWSRYLFDVDVILWCADELVTFSHKRKSLKLRTVLKQVSNTVVCVYSPCSLGLFLLWRRRAFLFADRALAAESSCSRQQWVPILLLKLSTLSKCGSPQLEGPYGNKKFELVVANSCLKRKKIKKLIGGRNRP